MPPRLSHRKSITGCRQCKLRRVKCDEQRPKCGHCARHAVACEYPSLITRIYCPDKPLSSKAQASLKPGLPSPELKQMRILEMRLIHQWVTETANTMSSAQLAPVRDMWEVSIPQMAFEYEPVLHTLLALGAAHRSTLLPEEAHSLRPVYHGYIDSAIQQHRPVTENLENAVTEFTESVCLNAILLSLYTLFLRSEPSATPYEPPVSWLSMAHGISTVMKTVYHELVKSKSRLCPLLLAQPTLWGASRKDRVYTGPLNSFQFLLHYCEKDEGMDNETREIYEESIACLERFYIAVRMGQSEFVLRQMFTSFPPLAPRPIIGFVAERRPRALVILAYHFALIRGSEDIWWLRGIPEREVRGINSILPPEWKWTMIWPLHVISTEAKGEEVPIPTTSPVMSEELALYSR